ncbi:MAG TPA: ABC transporter transmembrane domain-containing protein, partial [Fimbriimonadaceae bacterium]|nr:ABC transporter transmembrane domain-containing protein [Fimbriimonadaceae bacterium]
MAVVPHSSHLPKSESILFATEADLNSLGVLGAARLVVTDTAAYRLESSPVGEQLVASFPLGKLSNVRLENLVDATALIADIDGSEVELLRTSTARNTLLISAQKRLEALLKSEEMPHIVDQLRVCPKCGRPLPEDSDICTACLNRGKTLLRLFQFTKPYKSRLIWGTLLILAGTVFQLLPAYLTRHLVDDVLTNRQVHVFGWLIGALILAQLMVNLIQMARGRNVAYMSSQVAIDIRQRLFHKLQQLSLGFYDRRNVGSIMSRMTNDTAALYDVLVDGVPITVNNAALLLGIPIAMLLMNWQIALWVLVPVPFVLFAVNRFRRKMMRVWSRYWHSSARLSSTLSGVLQGTRVVKAFHGEQREEARFGRRVQSLAEAGYTAEVGWSTFFPMVMFTLSLSGFVVWWVGGHAVLGSRMTLGELTAFIAYIAMMQQPLMQLQRIIDWTSRSLTAAERVFE